MQHHHSRIRNHSRIRTPHKNHYLVANTIISRCNCYRLQLLSSRHSLSVYHLNFCQSIKLIFYIFIHFTLLLLPKEVTAFHHHVLHHTATAKSSKMTSMLRSFTRGSTTSSRGAAFLNRALQKNTASKSIAPAATRLMATQSGDDTVAPTALAKLHLEDGTTLTGRSFGSHESVDGEVS